KAVLLPIAIGVLTLSHDFLKNPENAHPEYPVLVLFAMLGMMLMVSSRSFLGLYVALELQSLSLYVLAAFMRNDAKSSEAGLKYFVLGALASGLLLYGISLIYGFTGTVSFAQLHTALALPKAPVEVVLGLVFVLAAFAFKIAAAPFHMWAPDVYEGAPTPVTAFFAAAPKLAGIALLIKVLYQPFGALGPQAQQILVVLSLISMAWGAFGAIAQSNVKRLMAYSSIGHVGYALIGLASGGSAGLQATLLYLLIYVPMTLGSFAVILCLRRDGRALEQLSDFAGLSRARPLLAACMALFMFSMIGVPPLAGFFGKLYVFLAALQSNLLWLALAGVVLSVVGAFYYLRLIKIMYFDKSSESFDRIPGWGVGVVLSVTAFFILAFILQPDFVAGFVKQAAAVLVSGA
ncbi:MAG: NADH-quinone oxidoreductase subunit NuoN, partial [Proteobacteria bacterium]|nr:NADH-quinone oxidoreductase subunit NuoN [Pseudomonadota bacterium]